MGCDHEYADITAVGDNPRYQTKLCVKCGHSLCVQISFSYISGKGMADKQSLKQYSVMWQNGRLVVWLVESIDGSVYYLANVRPAIADQQFLSLTAAVTWLLGEWGPEQP